MKYDFDREIYRRGSGSYKWDDTQEQDVIPLWVADMDFATAPAIIEALKRRVDHGVFGYTYVPDAYYESFIGWFRERHNLSIERDWIIYTSGVVPALSAIIKALTEPGDRVIVQTPVYNCFFSSIVNNGCEVVNNKLIYENGSYGIDFDDLERNAADERAKVMLICNPHNPGGRVWSREELTRIGDICFRHGVVPVSDEIHCELTFPGVEYTPFASISPSFARRSVSCLSPSKAFNIAGLQIANIVAADAAMRAKIEKAININEVCDVNPFGVTALIAAYTDGLEWLEALKLYLYENYKFLCEFFERNLPAYKVMRMEGTYLAWVDCRQAGRDSKQLARQLFDEGRVWVNAGEMYGEGGQGFIRINMACPRARLAEGLKRIYHCITGQKG